MHLSTVRLYPPEDRPELTPGVVVDLLWAHATPPDGVEHIHARAGPRRMDVAVFIVASDQFIADCIVTGVCRRAIRATPLLSGWRVRAD